MKQRKKTWRIAALVMAVGLTVGLGTTAAHAGNNDQVYGNLANVTPIQSVDTYWTFTDHKGGKYPLKITTTWQRHSSTSATIRSMVVRPASTMARCIDFHVSSSGEFGYSKNWNNLCNGGYIALSINKKVPRTYGVNSLGQFYFTVPNPPAPTCQTCGGARHLTIEYTT